MAEGSGQVSLEEVQTAFQKFAVHGDTKATGKEMNGKNFVKLCKDCKVIDGKSVTSTDVDIVFSKVKVKSARLITFDQFVQAMTELAMKRFKGKNQEEAVQLLYALIAGKEPSNTGVTKVAKASAVERLTDSSKYTGSHKERFDDSGKGKGREGREEIPDGSGYVSSYKGQGTYDSKLDQDTVVFHESHKGTDCIEEEESSRDIKANPRQIQGFHHSKGKESWRGVVLLCVLPVVFSQPKIYSWDSPGQTLAPESINPCLSDQGS
ncbi:hypothetical protein DNTS_024949 [Danionella cerebrum]|uniref:Uncharacterized protein n=1 Tax=Danionella cerebrum TaxID=2873325 RepID=A0A553MVZ8_9TELE|nr:hypothetical protein DNTS_024949 [Danionella translucida]